MKSFAHEFGANVNGIIVNKKKLYDFNLILFLIHDL